MNWAELYELSSTQKADHQSVKYTAHSRTSEKCMNCENFIESAGGDRCRTVECPIAAAGWCERYKRK